MEHLAERFWAKVRKTARCWLWTASCNRHGYGQIAIGRPYARANGTDHRPLLAHRVSWILKFGPIKDGLSVLHSCDNPACVRPRHLFLGTQPDNIDDMIKKGRRPYRAAHGSRNVFAKLNEEKVRRIRLSKLDIGQLAIQYEVTPQCINLILKRKTWKKVKV